MFNAIDDLQELGVYTFNLKRTGNAFLRECQKQIDSQFHEKSQMAKVYDQDNRLHEEIDSLNIEERLAVANLIESIKNTRSALS